MSERWLAAIALWLIALSVLMPEAPLVGPLSLNDPLPLAGLAVGGALVACRPLPRLDGVAWGLIVLALVGLVVDTLRLPLGELGPFLRGPGRAVFYLAIWWVGRAACETLGARAAVQILCACALSEALIGLAAFAADYEGPLRTGIFYSINRDALEHWQHRPRLAGTFNYEEGPGMNGLAAYLILHLPLAVVLARRNKSHLFTVLALTAALVLTYTRAALAAAVIGGVVAWLVGGGRARRLALIAAPLAVALLVVPSVRQRFLGTGTDRAALVTAGATIAAEHPWLGHGDRDYVAKLYSRSDYMNTPYGVAEATPHNAVVMATYRYGLPGGTLAIFLLVVPLLTLVQSARRAHPARPWALAGVAIFAAFALQGLTNSLLDVPKVTTFFALVHGVLGAAVSSSEPA